MHSIRKEELRPQAGSVLEQFFCCCRDALYPTLAATTRTRRGWGTRLLRVDTQDSVPLGEMLQAQQTFAPCLPDPAGGSPAVYSCCPTLNAPTKLVSSLANRESCIQASTECCELAAVCSMMAAISFTLLETDCVE